MNNKEVKTRFAPSPTGYLHVGGLRTALFNYLLAKKQNGTFALRIEDTDQKRQVEGADEHIIEILNNFGLEFDEGPVYQSKRLDLYQKRAEELIEIGGAYRSEDEGVIRQKIPPSGETEFKDLVYGKIKVENRKLDGGVLIKSDGFPTYNFANVVDDHEMNITHVLRGEEFIPSTPKHVLMYEAFGWDVPNFAHLPLILGKDKKKLSKRTGDVAVQNYMDKYRKEAILNFIALLGWNPKTTEEIFSLEELVENFSIEKINKSGAVFDTEKLNYINDQWEKRKGLSKAFKVKVYDEINAHDKAIVDNVKVADKKSFKNWFFNYIMPQIAERLKNREELSKILPEFKFYFDKIDDYEPEILIWKENTAKDTAENLKKLKSYIQTLELENNTPDDLETEIKEFLTEQGIGMGDGLWPLRVSLSGQKNSPSPFEIIHAFSRLENGEQVIYKRIDEAIAKLQNL